MSPKSKIILLVVVVLAVLAFVPMFPKGGCMIVEGIEGCAPSGYVPKVNFIECVIQGQCFWE